MPFPAGSLSSGTHAKLYTTLHISLDFFRSYSQPSCPSHASLIYRMVHRTILAMDGRQIHGGWVIIFHCLRMDLWPTLILLPSSSSGHRITITIIIIIAIADLEPKHLPCRCHVSVLRFTQNNIISPSRGTEQRRRTRVGCQVRIRKQKRWSQ